YFTLALSLYVITKETYPHFSFKDAYKDAYIGGFFSGITPSSSGGQFGQMYIYQLQGIKPSDSASILWLDFVMYQVVLMFYTAVLVILKFPVFFKESYLLFSLIFMGFLINGIVLVCLLLIIFMPRQFRKICMSIVKVLSKIHLLKNPDSIIEKLNHTLYDFHVNVHANRKNIKLLGKLFLVNVLRLTVYYSIPYAIGLILGIKVDFMNSLALSSYVSMANAFFPIPGASGGTEIMFQSLYSMILQMDYVSVILILWRVVTFHLSIVIGSGIFIYEKTKRRVKE
ncbi:MAG: YbhN family protein, partial [Traorella sp.]